MRLFKKKRKPLIHPMDENAQMDIYQHKLRMVNLLNSYKQFLRRQRFAMIKAPRHQILEAREECEKLERALRKNEIIQI